MFFLWLLFVRKLLCLEWHHASRDVEADAHAKGVLAFGVDGASEGAWMPVSSRDGGFP